MPYGLRLTVRADLTRNTRAREREGERVGYYDGDAWASHQLNEIKCGECEREYDEQEGEGNICPTCKEKEGERE